MKDLKKIVLIQKLPMKHSKNMLKGGLGEVICVKERKGEESRQAK